MADYVKNGADEIVKFILQDEQGWVLVERRSKTERHLPGLLQIPGGHVDTKDLKSSKYLLRALKRETMEELTIVPKISRLIYKSALKASGHRYRLFYYLCAGYDKSCIPKLSDDRARLKWLDLSDTASLPEYDRKALSLLSKKCFVICVTGTPGTGKTVLSKELAKTLNFGYLGLSEAIKKHGLSGGYDSEKHCEIVSVAVLKRFLAEFLSKSPQSWVIDGHMSHFLSKAAVDLVISCTTSLGTLKKRLEARRYPAAKIRENLDSEIFQVCTQEAKEAGHNLLVLDTTRTSPDSLVKRIISQLDTP